MGDDACATHGVEGFVIGKRMKMVIGILSDEFGYVEVLQEFFHEKSLHMRGWTAGPCRRVRVIQAAALGFEADARAMEQHLVMQIARPDCAKSTVTRDAIEHRSLM
jgi:hypothetical protein